MTTNTMESEMRSKVLPWMLKRSKSYSPDSEFKMEVTPNPRRKFMSGPEKIPATAVEV